MRADVRLTKVPTAVAAFRISAVMWNAHRVHYDQAYATEVEGHAGVLVPANLLSSYLCEAAMAWGGPDSRLQRITFKTHAPVLVDAILSVWARPQPGSASDGVVDLDIGIDDAGTAAVTGTARVRLPAPTGGP